MFEDEIEEVYLNPFKPNGISHFFQLEKSISNLRLLGGLFILFSNFNRRICKRTVKFLIRHRVMRCLIWICTVCIFPIKRTIGLYG